MVVVGRASVTAGTCHVDSAGKMVLVMMKYVS